MLAEPEIMLKYPTIDTDGVFDPTPRTEAINNGSVDQVTVDPVKDRPGIIPANIQCQKIE